MIPGSPLYAAFVRSQIKSGLAYIKVQLPTSDGARVASQFILPGITSMKISKTEDHSSDTCSFVLPDDHGQMSSVNPLGTYGLAFNPGEIDKKFLAYIGFRGGLNFNGNWIPNQASLLQQFIGFIDTDQQQLEQFGMTKTVNLIDLTKQFRFQVYDTFPHPIYGNQTLSYFDPTYNLYPLGNGSSTQWQCDGRMFTLSSASPLFGNTHIPIAVYVGAPGSPSSSPVATSTYTFDYANGIVTFHSPIANTSIVSLAGNPTYMAPETMIRKMLVEKASWSPKFLQFDPSQILLPQFTGQDQSIWTCMSQIANLTNPRCIPWVIRVDPNGVIHFSERMFDGPPSRTFLDQRDMLSCSYENSGRALRTVVRADAQVTTANGDQPIVSLAYDIEGINRYGLTEPQLIDSTLLQNVTSMTQVQAVSHMNLLTSSVLSVVGRPALTVSTEIWPDPQIDVMDVVEVRSKLTGVDKYFEVSGIDYDIDSSTMKQQLTLTEIPEVANYMVGAPSGVAADTLAQGSKAALPTTSLIGAVQFGTGANAQYPILNGQFNLDPLTQEQVIPIWVMNDPSGCAFNVFLNSPSGAPLTNAQTTAATGGAVVGNYNYRNLPPGYNWQPYTNNANQTVYYGTAPASDPTGLTAGETVYVGVDSIFYAFNHAKPIGPSDLSKIWNPSGNTSSVATGGTQGYAGQPATVYLWQWFYLCLDSTLGTGKFYRPVMRVNPSQDAVAQNVPATGGAWIRNVWSGPPGPLLQPNYTKFLGNIAVGQTSVTTPAPGFVGATVVADGSNTQYGVSYGQDVLNYTVSYVGYQKITRGHYCILAASSTGGSQFMRIPFRVYM